MAFRVAAYWDLDATFDAGTRPRPADVPRQALQPRRRPGRPGPRLRQHRRAQGPGRAARSRTSTAPTPGRWPPASATRRSPSARSSPSPTAARRTRPSAPPRCSRRPAASSGSAPSATMQVAQRLYENGFITYMRTDSTTLSDTAVGAARAQVRELYGADYLPDTPRTYAGKVKNAQEAHEAIRPAGDRSAPRRRPGLTGDQFRLYELIWKRTVASQMKDARRQLGHRQHRRRRRRRPRRRVQRVRQDHHLPRLPQGLRRGRRRPRTPATTPRPGCRRSPRATR